MNILLGELFRLIFVFSLIFALFLSLLVDLGVL